MTGRDAFLDAEKIAKELADRGVAWADADAAAAALEETKAALLAQLASEHIAQGKSVAAAELAAKASPEYSEHLRNMVAARRAANRARVRWVVYQAYVELLRSRASSERAAMTLR